MLIVIIATILVLGIAVYQATQGLFSAIVMAILTTLCAAFAFNYYEPLARTYLYSRQPAYADGIALVALLFGSLLVLRVLFDWRLRANVITSAWTDRIGGGLVGLYTGMILTGVLMLAIQMFPFGPSVLTYRPYDESLHRDQRLAPFYPDQFTLGWMDILSGAALSGERDLGGSHDDLILELACARNQIEETYVDGDGQKHQAHVGRLDAAPDSLAVEGVFVPPDPAWADGVGDDPQMSDEENRQSKLIVVRTAVSSSARNETDDWWRLPATHFRLVTDDGKSHYPLAYLVYWQTTNPQKRFTTYQEYRNQFSVLGFQAIAPQLDEQGNPQLARLAVCRKWVNGPEDLRIDWVYRIAAEAKADYMAFRRTARAELPKARDTYPPIRDALERYVPRAARR